MYWLVESEKQLEEFKNKNFNEVFIELILFNDNIHPFIDEVSLLYIKPVLNDDKGYMLCISHDDALHLDKTVITHILRKYNTIYVRDKKQFLQQFQLNNVIDISFHFDEFNLPTTRSHQYFYNKFGENQNINLIIPLVKHYEKCEKIWDIIKDKCFIPSNREYLNKLSIVFSTIESKGIKINKEIFNTHFNLNNESFSLCGDILFTHYNLHTITGRPSNSFNGINFSALEKETGCRRSFIPKNDYFIEYDLTAFHPSLVAKLCGFDFKDESPYEYFSREANIPLKEAKVEFIKQMYGEVYSKYKHIEFFKQMKSISDKIWDEYNINGFYECPQSGKKFIKTKIPGMTPGKLLSYVIQNLETSTNVTIMWDILKILIGKKSQLIMYVYDSFLLDVKDDENVLNEIEDIFKKLNLKFKINKGVNYNFDK